MTKTDQDIGTDTEPYYEGDSLEIIVTVTEDGSAKNLSGASTEWAIVEEPGGDELLSETDADVTSTVTDAAAGEVTVTVDAGATDGIVGRYVHELRVTDGSGNESVVTRGAMAINSRANR